jgi:hypothetical protein
MNSTTHPRGNDQGRFSNGRPRGHRPAFKFRLAAENWRRCIINSLHILQVEDNPILFVVDFEDVPNKLFFIPN